MNTPKISYTVLNTGHDYTGKRIQTLDQHLSKFVKKMSAVENTLTILMSDHGNTYTKYTHAMLEGRYEMFHPSFFAIVAPKVAKILGKETINSLRANQRRLLTMIDIHYGLKHIASLALRERSNKKGILGTISAERTCDHLPLRLPNLCVCEGWDTSVKNGTMQVGILEFAVGTLNNKINKQRRVISSKAINRPSKNCQHLVPLYFRNVRERNTGALLITTLDFLVPSGNGAEQREDIFHVEVSSEIDPRQNSRKMKLLSYDRLSQYGKYRVCADRGVDVRLCICHIRKINKYNKYNTLLANNSETHKFDLNGYLTIQPNLDKIISKITMHRYANDHCLYYVQRTFFSVNGQGGSKEFDYDTASFEILNTCIDKNFQVNVWVKTENMKFSNTETEKANSLPSVHVDPNSVTYVGTLIKNVPYWPGRFSVHFEAFQVDVGGSSGPHIFHIS